MSRTRWVLLFIFLLGFSGILYLSSSEELRENLLNKIALPYRIIRLSTQEPDTKLIIPIRGISVSDVEDTFGAPRSGWREHEGIDIFADRGTPIYSAVSGYVTKIGNNNLGGNSISIIGSGGRRYYYAHLDSFNEELKVGDFVNTDTVIGFVGNTGNATGTPPHLHFGMYGRMALNPYPLFISREQ